MCLAVTLGEMVGLARSGLWGLRVALSWGVEDASGTWGLGALRTDLGQMLELREGEW